MPVLVRFIYFIIISVCISVQAFSKNSIYFLQAHINSENNLPQNTIRDAMISDAGFLWLATENGLARYDGKKINIYNTSNSGLTRNRITQLLKLGNDGMYCLTEHSLLFKINESNWGVTISYIKTLNHIGFSPYHFFQTESLSSFENCCQKILPENVTNDSTYTFWVLQKKKRIVQRSTIGLAVYNEAMQQQYCIPVDQLPSYNFFVFDDDLFAYRNNRTFYKVDIEQKQFILLKSNQFQQLFSNKKKNNEPVLYWNYKSKHTFISFQNALFEVKVKNNEVFFDKKIDSLPHYVLNNMSYANHADHLILFSKTNGIYIYRKKIFDILHSIGGDNSLYAQAYDSARNSIILSSPFQSVSSHGNKLILENTNLNENTICFANNKIWCVSGCKLFQYVIGSNRLILQATLPLSNYEGINFISPASDTSFFLSSNKTLYLYSLHNGLQEIIKLPSNHIVRVYYFLRDQQQQIWLATNDGLFVYDEKKKIIRHYLKNIVVRTLYQTSNNVILIGTYGNGMYAYYHNQFYSIPVNKQTNLYVVHNFIEDQRGFIWISTNNGLYKITRQSIDDYVNGHTQDILYFFRYSHLDGLQTNEFNGGCYPSAIKMKAGVWSLPTMQGLVWFCPDSVTNFFDEYDIYVQHILLNDKPHNLQQNNIINTQSHTFRLQVFLSSPNWSDESNLYLSYKIDNDTSWNLLVNNNDPILIQNLSGGEHVLNIRKKTGANQNSYKQIELKIIVPKMYYEYIWFWVIILISIVLLIIIINKISNNNLQQRKILLEKLVSEKTRDLQEAISDLERKNNQVIASEKLLKIENNFKNNLMYVISHDIASPLRFMNVYLSKLTQSKTNISINQAHLTDLHISAHQLEMLLDNIVEWIKHQNHHKIEAVLSACNIHSIFQQKLNLFATTIQNKQIIITQHIDKETSIVTDKFILSMAIQNILGNAINFTQQGKIDIQFKLTEHSYQISVYDTGMGMPTIHYTSDERCDIDENHSLLGFGIGLQVTRELLKIIEGKIELTQNHPVGTIATIILLRKNL